MKWLIGLLLVIILGILAYCGIGAAVANSLTASITGPAKIAPDATGSFTVTATYSRALTAPVTLKVSIYEDDVFDDLLSSTARITIPAGGTTGTATVILGMSTTCHISGASGTSDEEDEHEVYVELEAIGTPPVNTAGNATSSIPKVKCE